MKTFFRIFAGIGTLFLTLAAYWLFSAQSKTNWIERPAILEDIKAGPWMVFEVDGQEQRVRSRYSSSDMTEGEEVTVHFPAGRPEEAEIKGFSAQYLLPLIFGSIGLTFAGIGYTGLYMQRKKEQLREELVTMGRGRNVRLPVVSIELDMSFKMNGRSPYVIVAQLHDAASGTTYSFKSEHLWQDPTGLLANNEIDVYVDPSDPKRYYVDTRDLT
jgi:hypothetical protein